MFVLQTNNGTCHSARAKNSRKFCLRKHFGFVKWIIDLILRANFLGKRVKIQI